MYCKFCGIETEYSKFKDGTACCKECYIENKYIIAEEAKRKREEMNKELNEIDISDRDTPKSFDPVIKPLHYNNTNIETRKVARDITSDKPGDEAGPVFNIIKYISRYNKKNGKQDVEKVAFYTLELLSILLDKEGKSRREIETYIFELLDNYKTQFKSDKLSVFDIID